MWGFVGSLAFFMGTHKVGYCEYFFKETHFLPQSLLQSSDPLGCLASPFVRRDSGELWPEALLDGLHRPSGLALTPPAELLRARAGQFALLLIGIPLLQLRE